VSSESRFTVVRIKVTVGVGVKVRVRLRGRIRVMVRVKLMVRVKVSRVGSGFYSMVSHRCVFPTPIPPPL